MHHFHTERKKLRGKHKLLHTNIIKVTEEKHYTQELDLVQKESWKMTTIPPSLGWENLRSTTHDTD